MAIVGMLFLWNVGNWYRQTSAFTGTAGAVATHRTGLSPNQTRVALALLLGGTWLVCSVVAGVGEKKP